MIDVLQGPKSTSDCQDNLLTRKKCSVFDINLQDKKEDNNANTNIQKPPPKVFCKKSCF